MKLIKVFSNKNFKNVRFHEHFNVVLATIKDKVNKKDTHNLGKTSLIYVINFLLLGDFNKSKGLLSNSIFYGQTFYLELKLYSGQYLIIKRSIDSASKISFKLRNTELDDFTPPTEWDEDDIPSDKAKERLNEYLGFDVLKNWTFRKSITYFLRTQQDYLDVYQLNKFKGKHIDWKPFVFELLGFDGDLVKQKLGDEEKIKRLKEKMNILQQTANINIAERDKILGLIDIKQQEKIEAERTIDKFNFFLKDNSITKKIIEDLDFEIQTRNTERYRICYEISKVEESLKDSENEVNADRLKKLFDDVQLYFPKELKKKYEDLEEFNKSISTERRKYLLQNLQEYKTELASINTELEQLENDKSEKLSFLTEKDSYAKFKSYQKQLSKLETEIELLKEKLKAIDSSVFIEEKIKNISKNIDVSIMNIKKEINQRKHAEINKIFDEILKEIVNEDAIISIKQNRNGNIDFSADYVNFDNKNSTSEAEGTSYKKLLCMAFDLSLLIYYSKNSFFRFVYHDGIIEGLDNRIKIRLLNKIKSICKEYNIQHIISLIDSDIPIQNDGSIYNFDSEEICLQLNDLNDKGKLFEQSF